LAVENQTLSGASRKLEPPRAAYDRCLVGRLIVTDKAHAMGILHRCRVAAGARYAAGRLLSISRHDGPSGSDEHPTDAHPWAMKAYTPFVVCTARHADGVPSVSSTAPADASQGYRAVSRPA
jgi:hypothetical protein